MYVLGHLTFGCFRKKSPKRGIVQPSSTTVHLYMKILIHQTI